MSIVRNASLSALTAGIAWSGVASAQAAPAVSVAAAATQTSPVAADLVPAPPGWKIESVRAVGSGCPPSGSPAEVWISPEGNAMDVELGFRVGVTPTDRIPEQSGSCTLIVGMRIPAGYAYAPTHLRVGGRAFLPDGTRASLLTTYGFQGGGLSTRGVSQLIAAPSELATFEFADDFANSPTGLQWSRCGEQQLLNVNMVLHVNNSDAKQTAWAAVSYATALQLAWRRCP